MPAQLLIQLQRRWHSDTVICPESSRKRRAEASRPVENRRAATGRAHGAAATAAGRAQSAAAYTAAAASAPCPPNATLCDAPNWAAFDLSDLNSLMVQIVEASSTCQTQKRSSTCHTSTASTCRSAKAPTAHSCALRTRLHHYAALGSAINTRGTAKDAGRAAIWQVAYAVFRDELLGAAARMPVARRLVARICALYRADFRCLGYTCPL